MAPKASLTTEEAQALVAQWGNPTVAAKNTAFSRGAILHALARGPEENCLCTYNVKGRYPAPFCPEHGNGDGRVHPMVDGAQAEYLKSTNRTLQRKLVEAKSRSEDLVAATYDGARDAMLSLGPTPATVLVRSDAHYKGHHAAEAALWHMTDWQGAKKTTTYNSEVMVERVMRVAAKNALITDIQRADHPVDHAVLAFGGDMVEGLFNFPTQPFEIDATIFEQFVNVSRLLERVVRYTLTVYKTVEVVAEWGNHGRIGDKRANVPRHDNFDRMCYEMARQLLAGEKRLKWEDCPEDIQRIEVGNYRALLIHGDEIGRNGFASINTIVQHVNRWRSGAYPWEFRDVYVGHYHTHYEYSMANGLGSVFGTGSTESDNRYAGIVLAASATPSQRLHFIDLERGRVSAQYKVYADA